MNPDELIAIGDKAKAVQEIQDAANRAVREALVKREHWDPGVLDLAKVAEAVSEGAAKAAMDVKTAFDAYLKRWNQAMTGMYKEGAVNVNLPTTVLMRLANEFGLMPGNAVELRLVTAQGDAAIVAVMMRLDGAWDLEWEAARSLQQREILGLLRAWGEGRPHVLPREELQTAPEKRRPPRRVVRRPT